MESLSEKQGAKVLREINILEKAGINSVFPHTSKIAGSEYKDLWELRTKFSSNNFRVIYFLHIKNKFILLHGFKKKTNKTPKRELEIAKRRMIEYKNRRR
ncbi:MAG: type II toxin-antitoxin system RelE/ParE family toxin [Nanoarchaeota archaeon]|nr:type II toxin-antitoxin system RelE/ParE family toxin [Nanoarchaeota archaeon]